MSQPRRVTDSFPRRRRRGPGRPPGRLKDKGHRDKEHRDKEHRDKEQQDKEHKDKAPGKEKVRGSPPDPALLDMLRRFDLCWEYGPCSGITRLQRWERAQALGLSPPGPIRDALMEHGDNPDVTYRWVTPPI
ncbi:DPOD4 polymerase, partial [Xiphorhynchus elegans]|nr:DPOD4 polymerase [Xiphorhynchus elegans]